MPRKKGFDPERALAKAMGVFWRLGYESASTETLMKAMVSPAESLRHFRRQARALPEGARLLSRPDEWRHAAHAGGVAVCEGGFAKLLFGLAAETREQHERGCLLLSANLQRDTRDGAIADFLRDNQAQVEAIFVEALRRAQTRGDCRGSTNPPRWLTSSW